MRPTIYPPVIMGLWPIAGITSTGVNAGTSRKAIETAIRMGVQWFDTAYSYGFDGESDRLLGAVISQVSSVSNESLAVIGKVGQRWDGAKQRVIDASPATIRIDAETSLKRLGIEQFDLLMLHSVDPQVPIEDSATAIAELRHRGLAKRVGVCNVSLQELQRFASVISPSAVQLPLNMLQMDILKEIVPWCHQRDVAVHVYWTLMKGILAGAISRDHQFSAADSRPKYPIYQGSARERTHRLVDRLQRLASEYETTVSKLSIGWTISQPGVTSALVGAKYDWQIQDTAGARPLAGEVLAKIDQEIAASIAG